MATLFAKGGHSIEFHGRNSEKFVKDKTG